MTAEARQKQRDLLSRLREQPDFRAKHLAYSASEKNRNRLIEVGRRGVEACRLRGFPTLIRRGATTPAEPTIPQKILFNALPASIMEFPVREGIKGVGWQIDLALTPFKLAIEIDGDSHKNPKARENDRKKDQTLQDRGWTVLRFWNKEILRDLPSVLSRIEATIALLKTKGAKHVVAS